MPKSKKVRETPNAKTNLIAGGVSFVVGFLTERAVSAIVAKVKSK